MKYKIVIICFLFTFFSCSKMNENVSLNYDSFEFKSWNLAENYQLKINETDTIYLNTIFPQKKSFYTVLDNDEKSDLFETINEIQFKDFKKEYWNDKVDDGQIFTFITKFGTTSIHEENGPKELFLLADKLIEIKKEGKFLPIK